MKKCQYCKYAVYADKYFLGMPEGFKKDWCLKRKIAIQYVIDPCKQFKKSNQLSKIN